MLDPRDRGALLEALRPPPGYVVDSALATTYSLDLLTLLTAPLAFSLFDRIAAREKKDAQKAERLDSFALLHAVRQHADRLVVFCQAGCTAKPKGYRQLLAYLEDAVVSVRPPNENGCFHPKLWVQRLTSETEPVRYRVLVLSRNLTFDQSWDTMLTIEGELADRKLAIADSKPLADLVEALPGLAVAPGAMLEARRTLVAMMANELRRVRFEIPEGFEAMKFWPIGHDGKPRDPFAKERIEGLLVVSPFVTAGRLEHLAADGRRHILVSRVDELEKLGRETIEKYDEVLVLNDAAENLDEEGSGDEDAEDDAAARCPRLGPVPPSQGLHAKMYIADDGRNAHVWTGSANASDAAFGANVELLVQLTGPRSRVGVDATLDGRGDLSGMRTLLAAFVPPEAPVLPPATEQALEDLLRRANRALSNAQWVARVTRASNAAETRETFDVDLTPRDGTISLPEGCTARVWPISLPEGRAMSLAGPTPSVRFERCSFEALTSFFAFEVTATVGDDRDACEFVLCAKLDGAPEDRSARVLHSLLNDPLKVLRFLRMLLATDAIEAFAALEEADDVDDEAGRSGKASFNHVPLFESLVRTLERDPHRLREVDRLVRELRATPEGAKLLPAELDAVLTPIWSAYLQLQTTSGRGA